MSKVDFELARWIDERCDFNVFATVTFKQALTLGSGCFVRNTRGNVEATCGVIRDRVFKKLKQTRAPFSWVSTVETGGGEKRIHAHMAVQLPHDIEFEKFKEAFHEICGRMDWVHDRIEVTPIIDENGERGSRKVIFYMLKEGADALAFNASSLRF